MVTQRASGPQISRSSPAWSRARSHSPPRPPASPPTCVPAHLPRAHPPAACPPTRQRAHQPACPPTCMTAHLPAPTSKPLGAAGLQPGYWSGWSIEWPSVSKDSSGHAGGGGCRQGSLGDARMLSRPRPAAWSRRLPTGTLARRSDALPPSAGGLVAVDFDDPLQRVVGLVRGDPGRGEPFVAGRVGALGAGKVLPSSRPAVPRKAVGPLCRGGAGRMLARAGA